MQPTSAMIGAGVRKMPDPMMRLMTTETASTIPRSRFSSVSSLKGSSGRSPMGAASAVAVVVMRVWAALLRYGIRELSRRLRGRYEFRVGGYPEPGTSR